jgi:hypothetical protein
MTMMNQVTNAKTTGSVWKSLYKVGGVAAFIIVVLIPIQSFIFVAYPPPTTVIGYFTLFQNHWFLGLLDLDLFELTIGVWLMLKGIRDGSET